MPFRFPRPRAITRFESTTLGTTRTWNLKLSRGTIYVSSPKAPLANSPVFCWLPSAPAPSTSPSSPLLQILYRPRHHLRHRSGGHPEANGVRRRISIIQTAGPFAIPCPSAQFHLIQVASCLVLLATIPLCPSVSRGLPPAPRRSACWRWPKKSLLHPPPC